MYLMVTTLDIPSLRIDHEFTPIVHMQDNFISGNFISGLNLILILVPLRFPIIELTIFY